MTFRCCNTQAVFLINGFYWYYFKNWAFLDIHDTFLMGEDLLHIKLFFFEQWVKWNIGLTSISTRWGILNRECQGTSSQINYYCFLDTVGNLSCPSFYTDFHNHAFIPITGRHVNFFLQSKKWYIKRKVKQDCAQNFTFNISFWYLLKCMGPMNHNIVSQAVKTGLWTFSEMESVAKAKLTLKVLE